MTDPAKATHLPAKRTGSAGLRQYQTSVAAQKRSALLRAARKVFLRSGYDRTTVAAIAASAGISPATFYKHFPGGKAQIFGEVVGVGAETVFPAIEEAAATGGQPVDEALRRVAHAYARMLVSPQTVGFFRILIAEAPKLQELSEQWRRFGKERLDRGLRHLLAERSGAGELAIDDLSSAVQQLIAPLIYALLWPAFFEPEWHATDETIARAVDTTIETFLARYRPKRRPL